MAGVAGLPAAAVTQVSEVQAVAVAAQATSHSVSPYVLARSHTVLVEAVQAVVQQREEVLVAQRVS